MGNRKELAKPIFAVKHDFVDSLDAFLQEAVSFHQAVQTALELGQVSDTVRPVLEARLKAFARAMMTDGTP